jgi:hypothetical protein
MAKKIAVVGIIFVVLAGVLFMMMRRSHMQAAGSQGSAGGLTAVNAQGAPLPAPAVAGSLPQNTAMQETGGLLVSLSMDPYPPRGGSPTTFGVNLSDTNGQPVSDATIGLDLAMPSMWMPPNQLNMTGGEAGKYQASGYFSMRGLWRIEVIITRAGQKQSAFFDVGL